MKEDLKCVRRDPRGTAYMDNRENTIKMVMGNEMGTAGPKINSKFCPVRFC